MIVSMHKLRIAPILLFIVSFSSCSFKDTYFKNSPQEIMCGFFLSSHINCFEPSTDSFNDIFCIFSNLNYDKSEPSEKYSSEFGLCFYFDYHDFNYSFLVNSAGAVCFIDQKDNVRYTPENSVNYVALSNYAI